MSSAKSERAQRPRLSSPLVAKRWEIFCIETPQKVVMGLVVLAALLASLPLTLCLNNTLAQTPTVSAR